MYALYVPQQVLRSYSVATHTQHTFSTHSDLLLTYISPTWQRERKRYKHLNMPKAFLVRKKVLAGNWCPVTPPPSPDEIVPENLSLKSATKVMNCPDHHHQQQLHITRLILLSLITPIDFLSIFQCATQRVVASKGEQTTFLDAFLLSFSSTFMKRVAMRQISNKLFRKADSTTQHWPVANE